MPLAVVSPQMPETDPLLTAEDVAHRLNVSTDWVWDHSSRRAPLLPVICIGDGILRYRQSQIEELVMSKLTYQVKSAHHCNAGQGKGHIKRCQGRLRYSRMATTTYV
jgi:predicted DNA-binding transcriptional regulator AlpA